MKPSPEELKSVCPDVDERLISEHLDRLDDQYFGNFDLKQIGDHLNGLARLSAQQATEILVDIREGHSVDITILAFDYPAEFSLITGVLAAMGFGIERGAVFTYKRSRATRPAARRRRDSPHRRTAPTDPLRRWRIIDHFSGHLYLETPPEQWSDELRQRLTEVMELLEQGDRSYADQAKQRVNEMVTKRLVELRVAGHPMLYPVEIEIENDAGPFTRVNVVSQDTPAFLYSLTTALSLHGLSIERVRIHTENSRIEDEMDLVDASGGQIRNPQMLDTIRLSVLLTKQFTYYLNMAPDPYAALTRFEQLLGDIVKLPDSGKWMDAFSNPRMMQDLARLLGTSDYLWEDFIRLQYESLLPLLSRRGEESPVPREKESLPKRLQAALKKIGGFESKRRCLNEFKNSEIFLADLDHILKPEVTFRDFAERLTELAATVVTAAAATVYEHLVEQYGKPRTVAGLEATYAILGLGKMGGAALGYASDIELIFVYSDNGTTDGKNQTANADFFGQLAKNTSLFIESKREGIFRVDMRLRPHGQAGPNATSLKSFCSYYGPGGAAHSFERLALVRMRAFAGDPELGRQLERLRDDFIYASPSVVVADLRDLREKQFQEKKRPGRFNAKFSPGALVDLEYAVQILQVMYAKSVPALRTPRIHLALEGLKEAGVLDPQEAERLDGAYDFLRQLINGLRMLRGSAQDLFLPDLESSEFLHLARRMSYEDLPDLDAARQLYLEFQTRTAAVRAFVERHFGRASLPGPAMGNVADLILSDSTPEELQRKVLAEAGFQETGRAYVNLRGLAGSGGQRDTFAKLAVLACDMLSREPNPDMALNNWERFIRTLVDPEEHYETLLEQPTRLEILLAIFSRSQFLAHTLVRNPELWDWVTRPEHLDHERSHDEFQSVLRRESLECTSRDGWFNAMRLFRHRHVLRVGTRDMYFQVDTRAVIRELSTLADSVIQVTLERVWQDLRNEDRIPATITDPEQLFCVLAFGKLGGNELNYSSDIDLVGLYDDRAARVSGDIFARTMERLYNDLSRHTVEGHAYRVDLRLRPYGGSGEVVSSLTEVETYYRSKAALWEIQATLKLRPVAGNRAIGESLLERLRPILLTPREAEPILESIHHMRDLALKEEATRLGSGTNIKVGIGGIRDIEFMTQALQLLHAPQGRPELLSGNTLEALQLLKKAGLLGEEMARQLTDDYVLLRKVEHYLQILENRQIHSLPTDPAELDALAKRVLGVDGDGDEFLAAIQASSDRVLQTVRAVLATEPTGRG